MNKNQHLYFAHGFLNVDKHIGFYFIYLFLAALVLVAVHGLSLVAVSRGYSLLRCVGFSLRASLAAEHRL